MRFHTKKPTSTRMGYSTNQKPEETNSLYVSFIAIRSIAILHKTYSFYAAQYALSVVAPLQILHKDKINTA
jgi:hypothetical protein